MNEVRRAILAWCSARAGLYGSRYHRKEAAQMLREWMKEGHCLLSAATQLEKAAYRYDQTGEPPLFSGPTTHQERDRADGRHN